MNRAVWDYLPRRRRMVCENTGDCGRKRTKSVIHPAHKEKW